MNDSNLGKIIAQGKKLGEAGEYLQALECFHHALTIGSDDPELSYYKGHTLEQLKRYEDALYCFVEFGIRTAECDNLVQQGPMP